MANRKIAGQRDLYSVQRAARDDLRERMDTLMNTVRGQLTAFGEVIPLRRLNVVKSRVGDCAEVLCRPRPQKCLCGR